MTNLINQANRIAIDTCAFIYFIQQDNEYINFIKPIFKSISSGEKKGITSYLTLLEVLVKPIEAQDFTLVSNYKSILINNNNIELFKIDAAVSEKAAEIRSRYKFKTPDAIQLAVAELNSADVFLSNDKGLKKYSSVQVILLDDLLKSPMKKPSKLRN